MNSQEEAFEKLSRLKVGALFMSMGTGKTKVALDLISSKAHKVDYILWICPYSLKNEIESERMKWHPELHLDIVGCESIGSSSRIYMELLQKVISSRAFIVVDESLKIKNRRSKRTFRIINLGTSAKYKLILNGTPISKNYCDLWAQMEFLSPKILKMSYSEFYNTYCEYYTRGKMKGRIKSFVNIPHLIDRISPYVFFADLDIDTEAHRQAVRYDTNVTEYREFRDNIIDRYYDWESDDLNFYALTTQLQRWYTQNSDRKSAIDTLIKKIDDRVIVFVRFLDSIPAGAHKITGEENNAERRRILADFKRGDFKVLYITYGCGAFGLNLQFCRHMIFAEQLWDYAAKEQAEARIYRIGQGANVYYYDLICSGVGLEDLMRKCITRKSGMLDTVKAEIQKLNCGKRDFAKTL